MEVKPHHCDNENLIEEFQLSINENNENRLYHLFDEYFIRIVTYKSWYVHPFDFHQEVFHGSRITFSDL
jgi:hypothetical protein